MLQLSHDTILNDYNILTDNIIDWKKRLYKEMQFFSYLFKKRHIKSVLQDDCASGNYALQFANEVNFVLGIDNNPYLIDLAKNRNFASSSNVFLNVNLDNLKSQITKNNLLKQYDCIVSLNNKLPLILNDDNLINKLKAYKSFLNKKGYLIIVLFNYNKLLKQEDYEFPKVRFNLGSKTYNLVRHMQILDSDLIKYCADVYDAHGNEVSSFEQLHRPLTKKRINAFIEKAGFNVENIFGDFEYSDFDIDSSKKLIVVAKLS